MNDGELWNRAYPSVGALRGEHGGRAPLLGTLKIMLSKDLETGNSLHKGPCWGT
jgi:hypothetical protein